MEKRKIRFSREMVFGIILTAFLVISSSIVTYAYASPYSYVSLDVNPSISFTLNRFNRVISVDALNEDGKEIISNTKKLKNKTIEEAISDTVNQISKEGYLGTKSDDQNIKDNDTENENVNDANDTDDLDKIQGGIVITVSNKDMKFSDELTKKIENKIHKLVGENVVIEASSIGLDRVKEAEKLGVSPGKLNLVEKLKASSPNPDSINTTEWFDKSVKDIMKAIHQNKVASKDDVEETNTEADLEDQAKEKDDVKEALTEAVDQDNEDQNNEADTKDQQNEEIEHKSPDKVSDAKVKATEKVSEAEKRSAEKAKEAQKHALEKEREALKEGTENADEVELKDDEESRDSDHKFTEDNNDSNHDQDEDSNSVEDNED